jgi:hypothetical protein
MNLVEKAWWWKLTGPFAGTNFTTIGGTLYYPKGHLVTNDILAHEEIHSRQQKETGLLLYMFLYLFCLPFVWNPWRWSWEYEAYRVGSHWSDKDTEAVLKSSAYGWLVL